MKGKLCKLCKLRDHWLEGGPDDVKASDAKSAVEGETYVVRMGPYIKIGSSVQAENRLKSIPHEEVLAVLPDTRLERDLHLQFAHLRVTLANGQREWFEDVPELREAIALLEDDAFLEDDYA